MDIKSTKFKEELASLLNRYSMENEWDMPDFLMAEVIYKIIIASGGAMKKNLDWHGVDSVCHPKVESPERDKK